MPMRTAEARSVFRQRTISSFWSLMAGGAHARIFSTSAAVTASSLSGGTTRLTRPQSSACSAATLSPVSSISAARPGPTSAGRSAASITEGAPTFTSGKPSWAPAAATRRSQAIASSKPAPRQGPLTTASVGKGASWTAWIASCSDVMSAVAVAGVRSRRTCTCMPAVKARPAPVTTAARTDGSLARASNAARSSAMSSGTIRLSGGRSSVTHAQPFFVSTRTSRAIWLVTAHRRIDGPRPGVEAARQVPGLGEAEAAEVFGDGGAAHALVAVDDDLRGRIKLFRAELDLLDRDVQGIVELAESRLPVLTDVEEDEGLALREPPLELSRRQFSAHG